MTDFEMATTYHAHAQADSYRIGFIRNEHVYFVDMDFAELVENLRHSYTSNKRGACSQLRVYVKSSHKKAYVESGRAQYLCEASELQSASYNRGDSFEKVIVERFTAQTWSKNSTPFWEGPDAVIDGVRVQIKLDSAELTNEGTLERMLQVLAQVASTLILCRHIMTAHFLYRQATQATASSASY